MEHLSKTAEKLMISPPSLSSTIKKLENELGTQLFDRSRQQMRLNENGRIFYRYVQTALNTLDCGVLTLTQTNCPILKVALTSFPVWIDMIYAYEQSHPEVVLEYTVITLDELNNAPSPFPWNFFLGIIEDVDTGRFQSHKVFPPERPVVLMSVHNPLAGRSDIRLEELKDEDFIFMNPYTSIYNLCVIRCREAGFSPRILRTARVESILSAVLIGEGISLLAGNSVRIFKPEHIAVIPLTPKIPLPVVLARHKERPVTRAMELFWNTAFAGMA